LIAGPKSNGAACSKQWLKNGAAPKDCYVWRVIITSVFEQRLEAWIKEMRGTPNAGSVVEFAALLNMARNRPFELLDPECVVFLQRHNTLVSLFR
jgi:hypothetical protein